MDPIILLATFILGGCIGALSMAVLCAASKTDD